MNGRSFEPKCASNECVFAGSWRDVPYKYAALRVLTQYTTSLKAGMSDRAPLRFPHLSFIRLEPYPARFARHLPHAGKALMWGRRCSRFAVFPMGKAVLSFSTLETHFSTLFHTARALSAPSGHFPHWKEKANGRSFGATCASTNARSQDHGEMFRINTRRFGF